MRKYIYFKLSYDADKLTKEGVIAIINEWGGIKPELLSLEEITTKKETRSENLKALRKVAIDYDWTLPDVAEVLVEIYSQDFSYLESINILKEVLHTVNQDSQLDWKQELPKIIERWKNSIQEYERRIRFERNLHHALETVEEAKKLIRKKEIIRELKDVEWDIQTLEKILHKYVSTGPHPEIVSGISESKKRKHKLLEELAAMDKKANIININNEATVKLTAHGQEILRQFYCGDQVLLTSHYIADNTYIFQLWELMKIFGKHMDLGMVTIFEGNKIYGVLR